MLELAGDRRLELNCSFALCKEVCIKQAMLHSFDKRKDKKKFKKIIVSKIVKIMQINYKNSLKKLYQVITLSFYGFIVSHDLHFVLH